MTGERLVRRLAAILAADVAGYSRLMGRDENGTLARLKAHRTERLEPVLARHGGRLVKLTGDGALVEFGSAVDALSAAIEFQQTMVEANRDQPADNAIVFRIGLHLGDLIVDGDDLYGDGVNVAARLEAEAPSGGIVISRNVHDAVDGRLKATFEDLGALALKNIARPMPAFAVKWDAANWRVAAPSAAVLALPDAPLPLPEKPSIAVLPFQNMSGDPEQEYFADGMVEDIITALSRFKSLFVIARNSSFTYKGKAVDIKQVGRELGVRYVLEGSVRKAGGRLRITGQLLEAASGAHIWADKIDASLEDVFDVQDRVTTSVVSSIAPKIERAEIDRAKRKPTDRLDSYDLFLKGMALSYRRSTLDEAFRLFKEALARDPEYAAAYAMAAFVGLLVQAVNGLPLPAERRVEAVRFAGLAAKFGSDDAFVLARSGHVLAYLAHEYDRASSLVEHAITLNPNLAHAWYSGGWVSLMCVQPERAIECFDEMVRLSPLDPLRTKTWYGTAWAHFFLDQYDKGCAAAIKAIEAGADAHALGAFVANAALAGRGTEARQAAAQLLRFQPGFRASHAHDAFPFRSNGLRDKIEQSLREAGIPA